MPRRDSIVSSMDAFQTQFPQLGEKYKVSKRWQLLERYFSRGGVLSIGLIPNGSEWPEIVYPTRLKLRAELQTLEGQRKELEKKVSEWRGQKRSAQWLDVVRDVKKLKEPLYWRHLQKYYTNKDYRTDADKVKLPLKLVSEARWKPMIEMFVKDLDYRKQLSETVETSIVYSQDKRVAKFAENQKAFRLEQAGKNLNQVQKKLDEINVDIAMLKELETWSKR